jgi:uncharacterized ubiquitin-like protein YukD
MKSLAFILIFLTCITICFGQKRGHKLDSLAQITYSQDSSIKKMIVGTWRDQNSVSTFKSNGSFKTVIEKDTIMVGKWNIENAKLILRIRYIGEENPISQNIKFPDVKIMYEILYFSPRQFEYREMNSTDKTIWVARKTAE